MQKNNQLVCELVPCGAPQTLLLGSLLLLSENGGEPSAGGALSHAGLQPGARQREREGGG